MNDKILIEKTIIKYLDVLENNTQNIKSIGLHTGFAGVVLFFLYAFKAKIIEKTKVTFVLNKFFERINNEEINYSLAEGLIGIGLVIQEFMKEEFLGLEYENFLNSIDNITNPITVSMFENNRYDYLHGGLGGIDYLLERDKISNQHIINKSLNYFLKNKITDDFGISWESVVDRERGAKSSEIHRPLGAAHGQASILHILTKLYEKSYLKDKNVILSLSNWILLQQHFDCSQNTIFPPRLINDDFTKRPSRLGWCTGDLGILYPLFLSSKKMKFDNINRRVVNMLIHTCQIRDLKSCVVIDNGVCHGIAGIAHIYHKLYLETSIETFSQAFYYWLEILLEQRKELIDNLPDKYDMNSGIAGIGLVLLSTLNSNTNWDRFFLLS